MTSRSNNLDALSLLANDLNDENLTSQQVSQLSQPPTFKRKILKGKKPIQRRVKLDFDDSDEGGEEKITKSPAAPKNSRFKINHKFIDKGQMSARSANSTSAEAPTTKVRYTPEYIDQLKNDQSQQDEDSMEVDAPVSPIAPKPNTHDFHSSNIRVEDDNDNASIIPVNEYGDDDNDDDPNSRASGFLVDDNLMSDEHDEFAGDEPLLLNKKSNLHIDEDLYDMELPMEDEGSGDELESSRPTANIVLMPTSITEYLETLKESIRSLETEKRECDKKYTEVKTLYDDTQKAKNRLLVELET